MPPMIPPNRHKTEMFRSRPSSKISSVARESAHGYNAFIQLNSNNLQGAGILPISSFTWKSSIELTPGTEDIGPL